MKTILAQFNVDNFTTQQYDQVTRDLITAGQGKPMGLIHHAAAEKPGGLLIVDVWESEEMLNKFAETLMPILQKNGVTPVQPSVLPVYNVTNGVLEDSLVAH